MDFKQFLQVLRRRWVTLVVMVGIALTLSGILSFQATPQYESKARIFISVDVRNNNDAYSISFFLNNRVTSYADLATSRALMDSVIDELQLDLTPEQLADKISAEIIADTTIIELTVHDSDPERAQAIARLESQGLTDYLTKLETPAGSEFTQIVAEVTDPATVDTHPVSPRIALNLVVAGLIGLLIGLAVAFARQILDRTVTSLQHIQELTESPVLANVGFENGLKSHPLLTDLGGFAPRTEAFRLLRTNLQFLDVDEQPRCLVISSAVQGEGKTMTSTNLAIALAQAGRRTLIIDADLRRPRVAGQLGLDAAIGLTTVLVGKVELEDAIQVHEPTGLHFLASGGRPPNPTEILQSRLARDLVKRLRDTYEVLIIDAPPLLPVADASVLSSMSDGTILVVKHGKTTREQVNEAITRLQQVNGRLFGVVVNMIPRRAANNYYYYYYEPSPPSRKRD